MAFPNFNFTPASVLSNAVFGLNLLTGSLRIDIVGIFDGRTFKQLFKNARPMRATLIPGNKVMNHPVETGVTVSDHKITLPKQIEMQLVIPSQFYASTYQQIASASVNATLLTVQTRAGVFPNMIIEAYPHQEDPSMYDVISMSLRLREVIFLAPSSLANTPSPEGFSPDNPAYGDTLRRGQQSPISLALPAQVLGYVRTIQAWGR